MTHTWIYLCDRKIKIRNKIDRYKPQDFDNDRYRHENKSFPKCDISRYNSRYYNTTCHQCRVPSVICNMDSSSIWNFSEDSNHKCNTGGSRTSGTNILVFPMFSLAHLSLSVPPFPLPLPPFISTTYIQ